MRVSMVIPTLNAEGEIGPLLDKLRAQTLPLDEIVVVDSSSDDGTAAEVEARSEVELLTIERRDFDHGLTRDMALRRCAGDIVCFMTQDAVPASARYVERLVAPLLGDDLVAVSSGRQLPKADARRYEQLVREFNYTGSSNVRSKADVERLGIKAYFATDVCAAYRKSIYLELGGFGRTDMSEDMLLAAKAVNAGYKIAYAADAEVYHSHNLTFRQQFERNRAIGRFLERNKSLLLCTSEVDEGERLAKSVASTLLREGNIAELLAFGADCVARFTGNRTGRKEAKKGLTV